MRLTIWNRMIARLMLCIGCSLLTVAVADMAVAQTLTQAGEPVSLVAADGQPIDNYGASLALDGVRLAVGAPRHVFPDGLQQGAVYVYEFDGSNWLQQALLSADNGGLGDYFGGAVALNGDTLVVGAERQDVNNQPDQGVAYVFRYQNGQWVQSQKLVAPDGTAGAAFGQTLLLVGDSLLLGATNADSNGVRDQGVVYRFERGAEGWHFAQQLLPAESSLDGHFGAALAMDGETLVVGAPGFRADGQRDRGAAFLFTREGESWIGTTTLVAEDGSQGDNFGVALAIVDDIIAVGADHDDVAGGGEDQGSVYLFRRDPDRWRQSAQLTGYDGHTDSYFGHAISLVGDRLTVGAWGQKVGSNARQGAGYLFDQVGQLWSWRQQVVAPDGSGADWFARTIFAGSQIMVIAAPQANVGENSDQGKVYIYGSPVIVPPGENKVFLPITR